jgi:DNA end-binding protein Ku
MARPLWKGHISFGMVSIPVGMFPGDKPEEMSFELLDDRDLAPIGYRKVNKTSGDEVPKEHIARGFRLDDGKVVIVDDDDLKKASPERTQTLEIHAFVDVNEVPPLYFERPYYLVPSKGGEKGYTLLRDAMKASKKAAIGSVVLRARQHLSLLFAEGDWLVVNTLRYASELRHPPEQEMPKTSPKHLGINDKELQMAQRLVDEMVEPWEPEKYHDLYREELLGAIRRKAESGGALSTPEPQEPAERGKVTDMMTLLKQSVARASGGKPRRGSKTAS